MNKAPGPRLTELLPSLMVLRDSPLTFFQQAARQYGDLVQFSIGPLNAFLLSRAEDIQHVLLENSRNYVKDTFQYNALSEVTGKGLLTNDGEDWLKQRRRMQPAFHRQKIQGFGQLMAEAAQRKAGEWAAACASGAVVDVDREMMELALEILGRALLGVDLRTDAPELTSAVLVALDHIVENLKAPTILPGFIPTPRRKRFQKAVRRLDEAVQAIIDTHRAANSAAGEGSSLLQALLRATSDETPMSNQQVRDELITILVAGHETVASALTWACWLLSQNPRAEEHLWQELDEVLAGKPPSVEDLPRLEYTRRVFDEALRLYPPAWIVTRKNLQPDTLSGVSIPAGSLVVVSLYTTQRNPVYWPDPDAFEPERFLPKAAAARPRFAYLPFGGGPRLCIGNHFALQEAPLILATLYQHYHLEMATDQAVQIDALVTLRPRGGLPMRVQARRTIDPPGS